ncbi:YvrJ family protein [[Brevibacterium] frigoritolerans]|uniref:YvrJ family protein n=1 Tax=Peribacillus frigoritolerans TaxID=450367 RepID=A0A941FL37_9BACI|nr:YvrJ family protein [Peribacillus frigoritolerans]
MWVSLVSEFGYPFVVSMFLLFRFGKQLKELTTDVENLKSPLIKRKTITSGRKCRMVNTEFRILY